MAAAGGVPILVARRTEALEEVKAEIERRGGQAWVYSCDITDDESVDVLVKELLADHDGIDMLVNNAGRSIRRSIKLSATTASTTSSGRWRSTTSAPSASSSACCRT